MGLKKNVKDHRARRNMGSAEFFRKQRKDRNAARPKQKWVPSSRTVTVQELDKMTDVEIREIVPAHWERP